MVLRRIFVPERDEILVGRRKVGGEELNKLYYLVNIIRRKSRIRRVSY
jgi:hypothetical protein